MKRLVLLAGLSGIFGGMMAQESLTGEGSVERRRLINMTLLPDSARIRAARFARFANLPLRSIYPGGRVVEIRRLNPNGMPEYLTTYNLNAARTLSTDKVWEGGGEGYALSGKGIVVGFWDGGVLRSTHVEFGDRAKIIDGFADIIGHATHVAGTVGAAGINPRARGMAGETVLEAYEWNNDLDEMEVAAEAGLLLSNHSYGYITGWDYNSEEERWEWYGDINVSDEEDYLFGFYHQETREYDLVAYRNPGYLIVKSAGNDRGEGPSPGTEHYVFENGEWVASTAVRQKDGGDDGFDSMGPTSTAKNILVVGSIADLPDGYTGREQVEISSFSAFGPTDDGRIKPDIMGNGEVVFSTWSNSDTDYRNSSGTSMSAPNVTGSLATLQELQFSLEGAYLSSAELKGLILHTADDAGNPGPDYSSGWGVMNTLAAADLIAGRDFDHVRQVLLQENHQFSAHYYSDGTGPVKATICWTDPPGTPPEPALDPVKRILVNDLDLRLVRELDGHEFRPFVLDPLHPGNQATTGDNRLDNVEQVLLKAPEAGFYRVVVSHKGSLYNGVQDFGLILSGLTEEYYASGITELTANNGEFILTSTGRYLPDMDPGWRIIPENGLPVRLYFDYFSTEQGKDLLYIYDGEDSTGPLLGTLDGTPDLGTAEFLSTSGALYVRFVSDAQVQDTGFRAIYCTVPPEEPPLIQGEIFPCTGSSELYLATGVTGADFVWEPPSGWPVNEQGDRGIRLSIGTDTDSLGVYAINRCGPGQVSWLVLDPLDAVPFIGEYVGDTVPCANMPTFAEVEEIPGALYEWQLPDDWLGSSTESRLDYIPGTESGTIRVSVSNACGPGDTLWIPVSVQHKPGEVEILTSRDKPCVMSEQQFYVNAGPGYSYNWEAGEGWSFIGEPVGDTVLVLIGDEAKLLTVDASNKCGSRESSRFFLTSPRPEDPEIHVEKSTIEGYKLITVSNASLFTGYQWYRNDSIINSTRAKEPGYIAYLPGTYTVAVTNSAGCVNRQEPGAGTRISQQNQVYTAYQGPAGKIVVLNATNFSATANIYHFSGKLIRIATIHPGYNEINLGREGAYIISITGPQNRQTTRLFSH
jgi:hypothetical protein